MTKIDISLAISAFEIVKFPSRTDRRMNYRVKAPVGLQTVGNQALSVEKEG
jgi:hypothetical protein